MKILLTTLNSKYVHSNLALKYLYSMSGEHRKDIDVKEFSVNNDDDYIYTEIVRGRYDVICFSCYIWNIGRITALAENIKKASPETRLVFGGPEVSHETVQFIRSNKFAEFVMVGEGESIFQGFLNELYAETPDFSKVRGLCYRSDGKIYINPPVIPMDMDEIPFPYSKLSPESDKVVYYESSRGCPFGCSYCLSSLDKQMRSLSLERVKQEIGYFLYKEVKQVKFIDRTFNWDKERCVKIIRFIKLRDNGITNFHFEICADLIDEALLLELKSARKGLFQFEIGIQSTNLKTLTVCGRNSDLDKLSYNISVLKEFGNIELHLDLIAGLPYEDYHTFQRSFNDVYQMKPDAFHLGFLKLLKGTSIRERAEEYQYIFREQAPYEVISNQFLTPMDLVRIKMIETVLDLYYNRSGFQLTLEYMNAHMAKSPFALFEELSAFYYLKGFQHRNQSKENLYRILMAYVQWKERHKPGHIENLRELISLDLQEFLNPDAVKKFIKKGWEIQ